MDSSPVYRVGLSLGICFILENATALYGCLRSQFSSLPVVALTRARVQSTMWGSRWTYNTSWRTQMLRMDAPRSQLTSLSSVSLVIFMQTGYSKSQLCFRFRFHCAPGDLYTDLYPVYDVELSMATHVMAWNLAEVVVGL